MTYRGYVNEKFLMTPAGIEPATFRFVAQHLNHCAIYIYKTLTGLEPAVPASERPQTDAIDCTATGTGLFLFNCYKNLFRIHTLTL